MKKVLFIAPASYPVHGAEAIVNMKLLNALFNSGQFDIDLISREETKFNYPSPPLESYGLKCYHKIIKVNNKRTDLKVIWQNIVTWYKFGIWFPGCHWAYPGACEAEKLIKKNKYDYVVSKNPPSFLVAYYLKKKYGIKWVASWNDPYPYIKYPVPYGKGLGYKNKIVNKITEIMSSADIFIFPNARLRDYMQRYVNFRKEQALVIPHIALEKPLLNHQSTKTLRLIHTGNLSRPRNIKVFLEGLKKAITINPDMRISLSILGLMSDDDKRYVEELELDSYFNYLEPVEYQKSLEIASTFDVAVIIEADCEEGIFLPTKVGDYMQIHLPIFAVSPKNGELNDLRNEHYVSYFADVKNSEAVCDQLLLIYRDFLSGCLKRTTKVKPEYLPESIVEQYINI